LVCRLTGAFEAELIKHDPFVQLQCLVGSGFKNSGDMRRQQVIQVVVKIDIF